MAESSELINRLIRLAVDSGAADGEARNAAMKACELLHRQGLSACKSWEVEDLKREINNLKRSIQAQRTEILALEEKARKAEARAKKAEKALQAAELKVQETPLPNYHGPFKYPKSSWVPGSQTYKTLHNRYDGKTCKECGAPITFGALCRWMQGVGVYCMDCRPEVAQAP